MKHLLKALYERIFKSHCPECKGVLDYTTFDGEARGDVYQCRNCKKKWFVFDADLWGL